MKPHSIAISMILVIATSLKGGVTKGDASVASSERRSSILPPAKNQAQGAVKDPDEAVRLYVTISGELKVNDKKVTERDLVRILKPLVVKNENVEVKVLSHSLTRNELTMRAIELCQGSGVWNISWASKK